jgi:hypothetical protein
VNASRWVVRGSRLFSRVSALLALRRKSRGDRAHPKAAPLQALGDRTSREHAIPFENEGWLSLNTPDDETFGFKRVTDLGDLVALNFDGPILHRTAGAARRAKFLCHFLDL